MQAGMEMQRKSFYRAYSYARSTVRSSTVSEQWNAASGQLVANSSVWLLLLNMPMAAPLSEVWHIVVMFSFKPHLKHWQNRPVLTKHLVAVFHRLLHVRNGNCKYHLGEETFKLAQSYMDKLAKHGHEANKAALYGELCALLFAKSHYDEVRPIKWPANICLVLIKTTFSFH